MSPEQIKGKQSNLEKTTATDNQKPMKKKRRHQESKQYFRMNETTETYCRICKTVIYFLSVVTLLR